MRRLEGFPSHLAGCFFKKTGEEMFGKLIKKYLGPLGLFYCQPCQQTQGECGVNWVWGEEFGVNTKLANESNSIWAFNIVYCKPHHSTTKEIQFFILGNSLQLRKKKLDKKII